MRDQRCGIDVVLRRAVLVGVASCAPGALLSAQPPSTPVRTVVDTLHGTAVADPYRWLESDSGEVLDWFRTQGAHARRVLEALPGHAAVHARIREIGAAAPPTISLPYAAGGRWFYTMRRAGEPVARGYVRDLSTGEERLVVDPVAAAGTVATLASLRPSPDGSRVLYGLTSGGSERVELRVRDVASGRDVDGPIPRSMWDANQWSPDGAVFFYNQLRDLPPDAPPTERYRGVRVMRHRLGDAPSGDAEAFSAAAVGADDRLFPFIEIDARHGLAFGTLTTGVEPISAYYVAPIDEMVRGAPAWRRLFSRSDSVVAIAVNDSDLYALTLQGGTRIVRTDLRAPDLTTAAVVLEGNGLAIRYLRAARDGLYAETFAGGRNGLVRIPWGGKPASIPLPDGASIAAAPAAFAGEVRADPLMDGVFVTLSSWTAVPRSFQYHPSTDSLQELKLAQAGPFDRIDGLVVESVNAAGHDGVAIPLTVVRPAASARDGSTPLLLYGYGAYGMVDLPEFRAERRAWFEAGGAYAVCHVRGGGYHGAAWHSAGQKTTKPNTWLDFIACAEHLIRERYTRPDRLAAVGGSAGGITVGRAITERPELFAAAVIINGMLDAVRSEHTAGGAPNRVEFGSTASEEQFRALLAMSAVHHVRAGTNYPAVLVATSLNDARVAPWHSAKFTAALQAANVGSRPILLRVEEAAGHMSPGDSDEQLRGFLADFWSFLMNHTGMPPYRVPTARAPRAPESDAVGVLRSLALDSLQGAVPVYYSPGHAVRARQLQTAYAGVLAHYDEFFGGDSRADITVSLALLDPEHWAAFTKRPYGTPHVDLRSWPRAVAVLPAANDRGFTADLMIRLGHPPAEVGRAVDVIGFHELGHLLMRQYFYGTRLATHAFSVRWFEEFMATYLGHGYLWQTEGLGADPLRAELLRDLTVPHTTLAEFERHVDEYIETPQGWANYGWFQAQFAERGRAVFAQHGLDFIRRVRTELPWDRYDEWTSVELLGWLERIQPGFEAWARALARSR
ncbi:MAG TPA: prolyl oligopeptidase family serine peptidase [Gemmatimonadaceae bacterium]|nr:prolyl oligopeptidase family serine peptidase [Gemmatimonadaceae bacterium]